MDGGIWWVELRLVPGKPQPETPRACAVKGGPEGTAVSSQPPGTGSPHRTKPSHKSCDPRFPAARPWAADLHPYPAEPRALPTAMWGQRGLNREAEGGCRGPTTGKRAWPREERARPADPPSQGDPGSHPRPAAGRAGSQRSPGEKPSGHKQQLSPPSALECHPRPQHVTPEVSGSRLGRPSSC